MATFYHSHPVSFFLFFFFADKNVGGGGGGGESEKGVIKTRLDEL